MSANKKNKREESNLWKEEVPGEEGFESKESKKHRIREVDFHRIEPRPQGGEGLGSFELEVKEKLASVESPREAMIREEEAVQARWNAHRRISKLLSEAKLTRHEKQAFWLFYLDGFSVRKVARRLGTGKSPAQRMKQAIQAKIRRVLGKNLPKLRRETR